MKISRSHDGTVYSGSEFVLNVSISFSETLTYTDIAFTIGWSKRHNAYNEQNNIIVNNDRIKVSNISIGGWATLTYSPVAISDRGLLVATVTASPLDELFIEPVTASSTYQLRIEGMACIITSFGKCCSCIIFEYSFQIFQIQK